MGSSDSSAAPAFDSSIRCLLLGQVEEYVSAVLLEISGLRLEVAGGGLVVSFELDEALGVPSWVIGRSRGAGFGIPDGGPVGGGSE